MLVAQVPNNFLGTLDHSTLLFSQARISPRFCKADLSYFGQKPWKIFRRDTELVQSFRERAERSDQTVREEGGEGGRGDRILSWPRSVREGLTIVCKISSLADQTVDLQRGPQTSSAPGTSHCRGKRQGDESGNGSLWYERSGPGLVGHSSEPP